MTSTSASTAPGRLEERRSWTFLTNHGQVLLHLSRQPTARMRDIAADVGITERSVRAIVTDLDTGGYITKVKDGRRNRYLVHRDRRFDVALGMSRPIRDLLGILS